MKNQNPGFKSKSEVLKQMLQSAVKREKYEDAARIRDELTKLRRAFYKKRAEKKTSGTKTTRKGETISKKSPKASSKIQKPKK